jgi:hypothetical protein
MKVGSSDRVGATSLNTGGSAKAASNFTLDSMAGSAPASSAAPTGGVTGIASIDALLALQSVGSPLERKKKAVRRASAILDILDEVKVALLDGGVSPQALARLVSAIRDERAETDEPALEGVLNEIETRAAVEMAKLEMLAPAA